MQSRCSVETKPGPIEQLVLRDASAGSEVCVAPSRGALATRFFDGARELLFLDEASFLDRTKNVRGGVPVLFPSPGKLTGDRWAHAGRSGVLKQHGFARNAGWTELRRSVATRAEVTLGLESNAETLRDYPWPFRVELTFALEGKSLRLEIGVVNSGAESMPYGFGFHPYFAAPLGEKSAARIDTEATRAWDNVLKKERALEGIPLGGGEVDLHLLDHNSTQSALHLPSGSVSVLGSDAFVRWVIWTLPEKEFICLEPWTGPGDALNTGVGLRNLAPGAGERMFVEIRGS